MALNPNRQVVRATQRTTTFPSFSFDDEGVPPPPPRQSRPILDGLAWLWRTWQETGTNARPPPQRQRPQQATSVNESPRIPSRPGLGELAWGSNTIGSGGGGVVNAGNSQPIASSVEAPVRIDQILNKFEMIDKFFSFISGIIPSSRTPRCCLRCNKSSNTIPRGCFPRCWSSISNCFFRRIISASSRWRQLLCIQW